MSAAAELCHVCHAVAWKYKCSQCRVAKCCSLACTNKHKGPDGDCPKRAAAAAPASAPAAAAAPAAVATPVPSAPVAAAAGAPSPADVSSAPAAAAAATASTLTTAPATATSTAIAVQSPPKPAAAAAAAVAATASEASSSRLTDVQLQRVVANDGIRAALTSSELRAIITAVDGAADRELALQQALAAHSTHFAQFVNELLLTLHGGADHYRTEDERQHAAAYDAFAHHTNALLRNPLPANPEPAAAAEALVHTLGAVHAAVQTGTIG